MKTEKELLREALQALIDAHEAQMVELGVLMKNAGITTLNVPSTALQHFDAIKQAKEALAQPAEGGEAVAYEVWWGLSNMRPLEQPSRTYDEAKLIASQIKSYTEIRPLYRATPPASQEQAQQPQAQAQELPVIDAAL